MSAEAIGFSASAGAAAWATIVEFMPTWPKVIVGSVLAIVAAVGGWKTWMAKRREQRNR